jgi:GntR family transcriptional regulator
MPTPDERRPLMIVPRTAYDVDERPVELTDTVKAGPSHVLEYRSPAERPAQRDSARNIR